MKLYTIAFLLFIGIASAADKIPASPEELEELSALKKDYTAYTDASKKLQTDREALTKEATRVDREAARLDAVGPELVKRLETITRLARRNRPTLLRGEHLENTADLAGFIVVTSPVSSEVAALTSATLEIATLKQQLIQARTAIDLWEAQLR